MDGHPPRGLEVERSRIDDGPTRDSGAAQRPRRRAQVLRIARSAEDDPYSPEEIFHAPETFTKRMRASSLSLFQVSPLGVATA